MAAVKINLLPDNYALSGPVRQLIKSARSLSVIFLALLIVTIVGMGGFIVFSSLSLKDLVASNASLKSQIQAESDASQQMVLLKDRLTQIKTIQTMPSALNNFKKVSPLLDLVTGGSYISELGMDSQKITTSIIFKSNSVLTAFLKTVNSSKDYTSISLVSFNYSSAIGYQLNLSLVNK